MRARCAGLGLASKDAWSLWISSHVLAPWPCEKESAACPPQDKSSCRCVSISRVAEVLHLAGTAHGRVGCPSCQSLACSPLSAGFSTCFCPAGLASALCSNPHLTLCHLQQRGHMFALFAPFMCTGCDHACPRGARSPALFTETRGQESLRVQPMARSALPPQAGRIPPPVQGLESIKSIGIKEKGLLCRRHPVAHTTVSLSLSSSSSLSLLLSSLSLLSLLSLLV